MHVSLPLPSPPRPAASLESKLRERLNGEVRFDRLARALYATDASIYEIIPLGVVFPRNVEDVIATVQICRETGVPIIARGAGTGLTGGAVGFGVQLDLSRHMNRISDLDIANKTVVVEPGVVLDELNAFLLPHDLHFAPDVATSSRATIGGMIANNSCGAHSLVYGRTVDHVRAMSVVLGDGERVRFERPGQTGESKETRRATELIEGLGGIRDRYFDEISRRFPKVMRSNGGYGLDRLGPPGQPIDPIKVLCGSEGTLGVVVEATLDLAALPKCKALAVLHFRSVAEASGTTPAVLRHAPSAVELIDRLIIDAGRQNPAIGKTISFLQGEPEALLVVEFFGESQAEIAPRLEALIHDNGVASAAYAASILTEPSAQSAAWNLRTAGLGLLMSKAGDAQPYSFVEDTAVPPARLREYIDRFAAILDREGIHAGYYAHASVGCIHVKPILNLKTESGVAQLRRVAEAVCDLAVEFGGTMTGEHGDGIVRSCWLERMYGPQVMAAFREVKDLFDPQRVMNPHKIVDPWPMSDHLRQGAAFETAEPKTFLDFSEHGGLAGLAGMCSGVGQCRQRLVGTMCPSFMATHDETHTTRARANALRLALSNRGLLAGLDDPALAEVMELCISCKACKTECPTGVDMARIKAEYLARRNLVHGASNRARFLADMPDRLKWASRFPRLSNTVAGSAAFRRWAERRLGLDARIALPRLATQTFRQWFTRHQLRRSRDGIRNRQAIPTYVGNNRQSDTPDNLHGRGPVAPPCHSERSEESPGLRGAIELEMLRCAQHDGSETHTPGAVRSRGRVLYFVDTWTNYFTPQVGVAAVRLLEEAGYEVHCPPTLCCGRPAISQGLLLQARDLAEQNLRTLARAAAEGTPIVGTEPSCISALLDEYPRLVCGPDVALAKLVASRTMMIETLLRDSWPAIASPGLAQPIAKTRRVLFHGHCHQKALTGTANALELLRRRFGSFAAEINSGCCGMAGAFGHEKEHYEIARAIGEQRLFPALRAEPDAVVAVCGFSCRQQIEHHTGRTPRHVVELILDSECMDAQGEA